MRSSQGWVIERCFEPTDIFPLDGEGGVENTAPPPPILAFPRQGGRDLYLLTPYHLRPGWKDVEGAIPSLPTDETMLFALLIRLVRTVLADEEG
jgi:hypothetical protein